MTAAVEWHSGHPWSTCGTCHKLVRLDKPLIGTLHFCLTACQQAGHHIEVKERRKGPPWARRLERYCERCGTIDGRQ